VVSEYRQLVVFSQSTPVTDGQNFDREDRAALSITSRKKYVVNMLTDVCVWSWRNTGVDLSSSSSEQADRRHPEGKKPTQDGHHWTCRHVQIE